MAIPALIGARRRLVLAGALALTVGLASWPAAARDAKEVRVAAAANFTDAAKEIAAAFEGAKGAKAVLSFGSTGQLYTQITQGAPFEVFLAADQGHPKKAVEAGLAVADSRFTYAIGRLVVFSRSKDLGADVATLKAGKFQKIAIANPTTAPYGAAAVEAMKALGVYDLVAPRIVQGNNIAQTFQFVDTGNAEIGFVALSQIVKVEGGARWVVPGNLHTPIAQDAVLLKTGAGNAAASDFVAFLRGLEARAVIEKYGYGVGE